MPLPEAPKLEPRIRRYELSDYEWTAIKPMLPNGRGARRLAAFKLFEKTTGRVFGPGDVVREGRQENRRSRDQLRAA
jgi:transposase